MRYSGSGILYPVPHRQYVFSIPIILRKFFLYNRSLLTFSRTALGLADGICGAVTTIQTFGDYATKWRNTSGFSVDNSVNIARDDDKGITSLAQYIIRSPFSTKKIAYNDDTGMVVYRSRMTHGKNKKNSISTAESVP